MIREGKYDEAEQLVATSSTYAAQHSKQIKLTQLMLFDADIALGQQRTDRAIEILQKTIPRAQRNQTRMLADAEIKLAEIYRKQHRLALAERYAAAAFAHTRLTNDVFTAPARLELTAQLSMGLRKTNASSPKHHASVRDLRGAAGPDEQRRSPRRASNRNEFGI